MYDIRLFVLGLCYLGYAQAGRFYFAKGATFDVIPDNAGKGAWTDWIDEDDNEGTGDYESIRAIRYYTQCSKLWCKHPQAMEVELSDKFKKAYPNADTDETFECQHINPKRVSVKDGFKCYRYQQYDSKCRADNAMCQRNGLGPKCETCANYKVRFFCLESDRAKAGDCPRSNTPFKRNLANALERLLAGRSLKDSPDQDILEDIDMATRNKN